MDVPETPAPGLEASIAYLRANIDMISDSLAFATPQHVPLDHHVMTVRDGRNGDDRPALDCEGFELFHWPSVAAQDQPDELIAGETAAIAAYRADCLPLVRQATGARDVHVLPELTIGGRGQGRRVTGAAPWAHAPQDRDQADALLHEALAAWQIEPAPFSRFALYQGWRMLGADLPDQPPALCDARSVQDGDMVAIDLRAQGASGRLTGSRHNDAHRWWYFPQAHAQEMILIKAFDSDGDPARQTLRTVVRDDSVPSQPNWASVETLYLALYD